MDRVDDSALLKTNGVARSVEHKILPPYQYLFSEQAKSVLALQELQNEVGALLEFRDMVIDSFPHLRNKTSPSSNVRWEPGVRVRRKLPSPCSLAASPTGTNGGKAPSSNSGSAIQDSGFCAESNKDASSRKCKGMDDDDRLWNLLRVIQEKGDRLCTQVKYIRDDLKKELSPQPSIRNTSQSCLHRRKCRSLHDLSPNSQFRQHENMRKVQLLEWQVSHLKVERDSLLRRLSCVTPAPPCSKQSSPSQDDSEFLISRDNLKSLRFLTPVELDQSGDTSSSWTETLGPIARTSVSNLVNQQSKTIVGKLDGLVSRPPTVGNPMPVVLSIDRKKITAILEELDPKQLQKHLITLLYANQNLDSRIDVLIKSRTNLLESILKHKEEIDDLNFQLEERNIQLEGTRARVRWYERLQNSKCYPQSSENASQVSNAKVTHSYRRLPEPPSPVVAEPLATLYTKASTQRAEIYDLTGEDATRRQSDLRKKPSKIPLKSDAVPESLGRSAATKNYVSPYARCYNANDEIFKYWNRASRSDFSPRNYDFSKNSRVSTSKCVRRDSFKYERPVGDTWRSHDGGNPSSVDERCSLIRGNGSFITDRKTCDPDHTVKDGNTVEDDDGKVRSSNKIASFINNWIRTGPSQPVKMV